MLLVQHWNLEIKTWSYTGLRIVKMTWEDWEDPLPGDTAVTFSGLGFIALAFTGICG